MEEGMEFEPTLKLAQEKGYAEPDPSFDIEGTDAAHKIGILSSLAFGSSLPPKDFYIEGINGIHKDDFKYAYEMGYTIKHLAIAKSTNNSIDLRAHPSLVKLDSYLANLKGVRNGIEVETDLLGTLHIAGSGAGQEATASGVISDLIYLSDSKIREVNNINESIELINFIDLNFQYYFYIEASDVPGVMASISSIFANKDVSIESISQKENLNDDLVPIIIITDPFKEKDYQELVNNLLELDSINKIRSIRIEPQ
jgi:homoserine dehydrogenase